MKFYLKFLSFSLFWLSFSARSAELRYTLEGNIQSSDNITQRSDGGSGSATTSSALLSLASTGNIDLTYDMAARLSRIDYSISELSSESTTSFEGNANYQPRETNFSVLALGNITQVPVNRFQTQQVNNTREERAVALMPTYFIRMAGNDRLNFSSTFVNFDSESNNTTQQLDNSRVINEYAMGYEKQVNETNALSLIAKKSKTDFKQALEFGAIDFDKDEVYLKWSSEGRTNRILAEYGRSKLVDQLGRELESDLKLFNLVRQINRNQTLEYRFVEGIEGALSTNLSRDRIVINQRNENIPTAQKSKENTLLYSYSGVFFRSSLSITERKVSQIFSENKEIQDNLRLAFSYSLARILGTPLDSRVELFFDKNENEFDNEQTNITNTKLTQTSLIYRHMYSEQLSFYLELQQRRSKEISIDLSVRNNDSDSIFFGVAYSNGGRF